MSALSSLQSRVEKFLDERRRWGFSDSNDGYSLRSLAHHVRAVGHRGPSTVEVMADWARLDSHGSSDPHTWARRLKKLRTFMRWLQQFEPRTEVPDDAIFGRLPERQAPHIYSEQEIVDLLAGGATARARTRASRRRLRDTVRPDRLYGSSHRRGAVAAQRGCRFQGREVEHPPDQVRQVATGANAPQHRGRAASVSLDARSGGRACRRRCRVLHRHARSKTGVATGRRLGTPHLRRTAPAAGLAQPRSSPCPAHP